MDYLQRGVSCLRKCYNPIVNAWDAIQIELHGRYSIERMQHLDEYAKSTSIWYALLIVVMTPVPCIVMVAIMDAVPLQPIQLGIEHSHTFWVRAMLAVMVYSSCTYEMLRFYLPCLPLSDRQILLLSLLVAVTTNIATFILAILIGYPIPFTIPATSVPWALSMIGLGWLSLRNFIQSHPQVVSDIWKFMRLLFCQMSFLFVYPVYYFIFIKVPSNYQPVFALVLPIIKLVEKNTLGYILNGNDDVKPGVVILNVEVFNALFVSCCIQSANSIRTNLVIMIVDFLLMQISLNDLSHLSDPISRAWKAMGAGQGSLIDSALEVCCVSPEIIQHLFANTIQHIDSGIEISNNKRFSSEYLPVPSTRSKKSAVAICPAPINLPPLKVKVLKKHMKIIQRHPQSVFANQFIMLPDALIKNEEREMFVANTLQILYLSEFLLLIEFIEVAIPILYSIYLLILFHLPNRVYYPQLKDMDNRELKQTLSMVMMNGSLELFSLVMLLLQLRRRLHISPIRQLAFVLETEGRMVQANLILWIIVVLQYTLAHLGADYTFKFSWLHDKAKP